MDLLDRAPRNLHLSSAVMFRLAMSEVFFGLFFKGADVGYVHLEDSKYSQKSSFYGNSIELTAMMVGFHRYMMEYVLAT